MIERKEFYYIRHGQTDHNIGILPDSVDLPLNATGIQQAFQVQSIIETLPVKSICLSPLRRAKETKAIVASKLVLPEYEIQDLAECSVDIWHAMTSLGIEALYKAQGPVQAFIEQVKKGVNHALLQPGPVLIVAHGGVHWAMCCLMGVEHEWAIDNCVPVHFSLEQDGKWFARKLI